MNNLSCLSSLGANQLVIVNTLIALAISDDLSADDLNVLGNFIVAAGSLILTKAAQLAAQNSKNIDIRQQLQDLEDHIEKIKKNIKK